MSTLFNLRVPLKEKEISHHPWESTVKDVYSNKIKTAHNSANNPRYPEKKEKPVNKDRIKFTIIGNRVTEEFLYCVNLVRGLYTYRKKHFDTPVIRGVTSVEWPTVWNDLKLQYGGLAYCLKSQVAVFINDKILGGEKELKEFIDLKYIYYLSIDYCKESVNEFAKFVKGSGRPCAYFHISIDDSHIGTMIFMLYDDIAPYTCDNFLRLCKETKGGYSGTPIHRIVRDGWIQCGGFGLKEKEFYCENFIVPPDRRGVLCMANAGRHVECSTQFFILLQPSSWMAYKYVAFGQLIDGESTLKKIESVETWYQSPVPNIVIYRAGILNLDCQDIMINRGAKEYIQGHIEDLFAIGEIFLEELMMKVFFEIEIREIDRLRMMGEGATEEEIPDLKASDLHATERFMRKKASEAQKLIDKSSIEQKSSKPKGHKPSKVDPKPSQVDSRISKTSTKSPRSQIEQKQSELQKSSRSEENNDFDVSVYEYEPEEYSYQHVSLPSSIVVKAENPYYIPLTDVPYPGEVNSIYNLQKFLRGDYCLESDLEVKEYQQKACVHKPIAYPSEILQVSLASVDSADSSLDSDEENEIKTYLQYNTDRVSFAGSIIRNIVRGNTKKHNIFEGRNRSELVTDDELRRYRLASADLRHRDSFAKKVSISVPTEGLRNEPREIKRRQTGFVRPADLEKIHIFDNQSHGDMDDESVASNQRKVRLEPITTAPAQKIARRQTAFMRPGATPTISDFDVKRQSVLTRLYEDQQYHDDEDLPTLKDYKRPSVSIPKPMLLTQSAGLGVRSDDKMDHYRRGLTRADEDSLEQAQDLQHGKKLESKVSSDYAKITDQAHQSHENSLRTVEYIKVRPAMSVSEYQAKNQKYIEQKMQPASKASSIGHDQSTLLK